MVRTSVQTLNIMDDKDDVESLPEIKLEWIGNIDDHGWKPTLTGRKWNPNLPRNLLKTHPT